MQRVSAAFVTFGNKILLFHRDNNPKIIDPDCWSLIGGHVEDGETYEQGLIRELEEEIRVTPSNFQFLFDWLGSFDEDVKLYHVRLTPKEAEEIKLGNEGQEVKFFSFDQIEHLNLTKNLKNIYEKKKELIHTFL